MKQKIVFSLLLAMLFTGCSHLMHSEEGDKRYPASAEVAEDACSFNIESVKTDEYGSIIVGVEAYGMDITNDPERDYKIFGSLEAIKVTDDKYIIKPKSKLESNEKPYCSNEITPSGKPVYMRKVVYFTGLDLALFVRHIDSHQATYEYFYDMIKPALVQKGLFKSIEIEFQNKDGKRIDNLGNKKILTPAFFVPSEVSDVKAAALNKNGEVERKITADFIDTHIPTAEIIVSACERVSGCEFITIQRLPKNGFDEIVTKPMEVTVRKRSKLTSTASTALKFYKKTQ